MVRVAAAAIVGVLLLGGCGRDDGGARDLASVTRYLRERGESADFSEPPQPLVDAVAGAKGDAARAVVVGRVVDGRLGGAFTADGRRTTERAADWQTVHVRIEVAESLDDEVERRDRFVTAGFVVDPDLEADRVVAGLVALGRAVFVLGPSAVFAYDPEVLGVGREGTMVAAVGEDGSLTLPFMDGKSAAATLAGAPTLARLRAAAAAP